MLRYQGYEIQWRKYLKISLVPAMRHFRSLRLPDR